MYILFDVNGLGIKTDIDVTHIFGIDSWLIVLVEKHAVSNGFRLCGRSE